MLKAFVMRNWIEGPHVFQTTGSLQIRSHRHDLKSNLFE